MTGEWVPERTGDESWIGVGGDLVGFGGVEIGKVSEFVADIATGRLKWAMVSIGSAERAVPLVDATADGDRLIVPVERESVVTAPIVEASAFEGLIEDALYEHYGIDPGARSPGDNQSVTGGPPPGPPAGGGKRPPPRRPPKGGRASSGGPSGDSAGM